MKKIIRVIVILLLLGAAAFAVAVIVQKNKDKKDKATEQVSVIVQDPSSSQPNATPSQTSPSAQPGNSAPVAVSPAAEPVSEPTPVADTPPIVVPSPVVAPKPAPSGTVVFKSASGVRVTIPAVWHPQEEVRDGKTYTVFYNMQSEVVASIESFVDFGNTLELIEQQLRSSTMVYNIQRVTVASYPALQYETPRGRMLALVQNNTTYYISSLDSSKIAF